MAPKRLGAYKVPFKETLSQDQPTKNAFIEICETSKTQNDRTEEIELNIPKKLSSKRKRKNSTGPFQTRQKNLEMGKNTANNKTKSETSLENELKKEKKEKHDSSNESFLKITSDIWDTLQAIVHEVVKQVCEDKLEPLQNYICTDYKITSNNFGKFPKLGSALCCPVETADAKETENKNEANKKNLTGNYLSAEKERCKLESDIKGKSFAEIKKNNENNATNPTLNKEETALDNETTATVVDTVLDTSSIEYLKQDEVITECNGYIQKKKDTADIDATSKTLSIFSMSALDLEKENLLKNEHSCNEISKREGGAGKDEHHLNKSRGNFNKLQNEIEESFYDSFVPITDLCKEHTITKDREILCEEKSSLKMQSFLKNQNLNNHVEIKETEALKSSIDGAESVGKNKNDDKKVLSEVKESLGIFKKEDLITEERIVFREKDESERDIIPTGIFQPLNEIFHYNEKDDLFEPKNEGSQDICSEQKNGDNLIENSNISSRSLALANSMEKQKIDSSQEQYGPQDNEEANNEFKTKEEKHKINVELEILPCKEDVPAKTDQSISCSEGNPTAQAKRDEENNISESMEMDDDFNLTASQLSMLEADEKMEIENYSNGKCSTGQQTDISGIQNELNILNQLSYLRNCIEYIKERIDK